MHDALARLIAPILVATAAACLNHQGNGSVIACLAGRADSCRDGGFAAIDQAIDACIDKTAKGPERTCEDRCEAARRECDGRCGIDRVCDTCLRAGNQCQSICPDAGIRCLDCSAECGHAYTFCSDSCLRGQ